MRPLTTRMKQAARPLLWEQSRWQMRRRVQEFLATIPEDRPTQNQGVVVVAPWGESFVPWYTLVVGLMLAKDGSAIRFVVDDVWRGENPKLHAINMRAIRSVMALVAQRFDVTYLSEVAPGPVSDEDFSEIERLAQLNATWALRGEMKQEGRADKVAEHRRQGQDALAHISAYFADLAPTDFLYVPGGVFGDSGLWLREARAKGLRVATFDAGGYETTMIASDGIACQLQDIPRAFHALTGQDAADNDRAFALQRAEQEMQKRRAGKDAFESQVANTSAVGREYEGGILLALNSSWDAAALGLHRAYPDNTTWIVETTRYLLENTDRLVIVRQHPAERLAMAATSEDYRKLLGDAFGDHPRLRFIAAADPINSYELLEQVGAVAVHTSTIGMEAVAFGRPVITGSASQYAGLGFVENATTRADYEALLSRAANGELEVTEQMRADARLCFYLTQCCNWIFSVFNPTDFKRWIREPLSRWYEQPSVQRMLASLATGVPVALLNHRHEAENSPAAS